jgi:hypothetical protein
MKFWYSQHEEDWIIHRVYMVIATARNERWAKEICDALNAAQPSVQADVALCACNHDVTRESLIANKCDVCEKPLRR